MSERKKWKVEKKRDALIVERKEGRKEGKEEGREGTIDRSMNGWMDG